MTLTKGHHLSICYQFRSDLLLAKTIGSFEAILLCGIIGDIRQEAHIALLLVFMMYHHLLNAKKQRAGRAP